MLSRCLGVISQAGLEQSKDLTTLTDSIAFDIALWDQKACCSPQALYVENLDTLDSPEKFLESLGTSLQRLTEKFPTTAYTKDSRVEVLRFREAAITEHLITGKDISILKPESTDWTIVVKKFEDDVFETSPLNRTIIVKSFSSLQALTKLLASQSFFLPGYGRGFCRFSI